MKAKKSYYCFLCSSSWESETTYFTSKLHRCSSKEPSLSYEEFTTQYPSLAKELAIDKNPHYLKKTFNPRHFLLWRCDNKQVHYWKSPLNERLRGKKCIYCFGRKFQKGVNDFATFYPELVELWDRELNDQTSHEVKHDSFEKVWWKCRKGHSFLKAPRRIIESPSCSVCSGRQIISGVNDLQTTDPELLDEWDWERNTVHPNNVTRGSSKDYFWWICSKDKNHRWKAKVKNRACHKTGCPQCSQRRSGMEEAITQLVQDMALKVLLGDKSFTHPYELDILIPALGKAIEVNGDYWHSDEVIARTKRLHDTSKAYHSRKKELCSSKGIALALVWEYDWKHNQNEVKDSLKAWLSKDQELSSFPILNKTESVLDNPALYRL